MITKVSNLRQVVDLLLFYMFYIIRSLKFHDSQQKKNKKGS